MVDPNNEETRDFIRELTDHQSALRSFVGYLMSGATGVSDVVQEVNLLLWEKKDQYEPGTNFRAWAFAAARYSVFSHRRKMRRDGMFVFDDELIDQLADEWEEEDSDHDRLLGALHRCLAALPEKDASLIQTRYSGHGNVENEALKTGQNSGNLRIRLFRLRAALKQCVLRELAPEGGGL